MIDSLAKRYYSEYLDWLIDSIDTYFFGSSYVLLLRCLASTDFEYVLERDANRASDGIAIRNEYIMNNGLEYVEALNDIPCNVLEMMIGLAMRMTDYTQTMAEEVSIDSHEVKENFRLLLVNIGLSYFDDEHYDETTVLDILYAFMQRHISSNGDGGLFPLVSPSRDQRDVEIWYQMQEYFMENN